MQILMKPQPAVRMIIAPGNVWIVCNQESLSLHSIYIRKEEN